MQNRAKTVELEKRSQALSMQLCKIKRILFLSNKNNNNNNNNNYSRAHSLHQNAQFVSDFLSSRRRHSKQPVVTAVRFQCQFAVNPLPSLLGRPSLNIPSKGKITCSTPPASINNTHKHNLNLSSGMSFFDRFYCFWDKNCSNMQ